MKSKLACLLLIAWPLLCFAEDGIIPPGRVFLSPDKSMYVKLLDYDREYHYAITDNKTGKVSILEARFNPFSPLPGAQIHDQSLRPYTSLEGPSSKFFIWRTINGTYIQSTLQSNRVMRVLLLIGI